MRITSVLVAVCLGLLGWAGSGWAADDGGPSANCLMCHGADHEKMAPTPHL